MSQMGHKQTFRIARAMSALPPIADICSALAHVRFVPKADIHSRSANADRSSQSGFMDCD